MATAQTEIAPELRPVLLFYIPCPDKACAQSLAEVLLKEKLIGCANILPNMESHYWWQGQLEQSSEHVLVLKTLERPGLQEKLSRRIEELHPYDIPCVMVLPILGINESYKKWLEESMK